MTMNWFQWTVKKIRIIPRRKLRATYSQRGIVYMQVGAEYVRQVTSMLKTGINSIKMNSFAAPSEGCSIVPSPTIVDSFWMITFTFFLD